MRPSGVEYMSESYNFDYLLFDKNPTAGEVWDRLVFVLGMAGLMVVPDIIETLRHDEQNKTVTIVTSQRLRFFVKYQGLTVLDPSETGYCWIYDWFDVRSGSTSCPDVIRGLDDTPQRLIFYPSKRSGPRAGSKDLVAISCVKEEDIDSWDHAIPVMKIRCLKLMKARGINGGVKGYNKKGKPRYERVSIEHGWRETKKDIKSLYTLEELCKMKIKGNRLTNLTTNLFLTTKTFTSQE